MKTCSKCKKDFPRDRFVKSPRYVDGLYPLCKGCRKAIRLNGLKRKPLCSHCRFNPHQPNHAWCLECQRIERGEPKIPKFRRDTSNRTLCSRCKVNLRLPYHNYCKDCKNTHWVKWLKETCWYKHLTPEKKRKITNRRYFGNLVAAGKEQRKSCEICGEPKAEIHHLDYNHKTRNIRWLCKKHHVEAERVKKSLLTEQPLLL